MTRKIAKVHSFLVVAVLLGGMALAPSAQSRVAAKRGQHPVSSWHKAWEPNTHDLTKALIRDLRESGFQVSQGSTELYTQQDCIDHTYPKLKNCFQANPAAPYVVPVVKLWPDEYMDPDLVDAFVDTKPGYTVTYRLDPREAIVIYGEMPPPGRYMGLQTWEFSQYGEWSTDIYNYWANMDDLAIPIQYLFDTVPPDDTKSHRVITFSALGDVVNNVVMQRQLDELDEDDDNPFGKTLYFIITPSGSTDNAIRQALQDQGIPDGKIFTQQIPRRDDLGFIGPLGMRKKAIDFFTAFRYAVPDPGYEKAAEHWRKKPPLRVLRVRAPESLGRVQRYGSLSFEPRTANSELDMADDLQALVGAVRDSVTNNTGLLLSESSSMVDLVRDYGWTGPYCRDVGMDCQGDQQEAAYYMSSPRALNSGQVYAVVGTLATETDNATYVGLSANDASIMGGVANVLDTGLLGSADVYKSALGYSSKFFFVHYFTTDCDALKKVPDGMENCTEIGDMSTIGDPNLQGMIIITLRDYIAPGTQRGPDSSLLLRPRILTFLPN